jgi:hypothetical protein
MGNQSLENNIDFEEKTKLKEVFILKKGPVLINKCLSVLRNKLQKKETTEEYLTNQKDLNLGFILNLLEIQKSCMYLKLLLEDSDPIKKWKQVLPCHCNT